MKKFISGLLVGVLLMGTVTFAAPALTYVKSVFTTTVNGKAVKQDVVTIKGVYYANVKQLTSNLGVKYTVDAKTKKITIGEKVVDPAKTNYKGWVPYSTSDLKLLADNILKGYVVYYKGQYLASPKYIKMISNEEVVYNNDIAGDSSNDSGGRANVLNPDGEYEIVDK